jgi:hypothetical protein
VFPEYSFKRILVGNYILSKRERREGGQRKEERRERKEGEREKRGEERERERGFRR